MEIHIVIGGNAHRHLFPGVGRQVEHADAEEGDEDARYDEVDGVEERLAADAQRERDERLVMAFGLVEPVVDDARTRYDVPRAAVDVVAQVDLLLSLVPVQNHLRRQHRRTAKTLTLQKPVPTTLCVFHHEL